MPDARSDFSIVTILALCAVVLLSGCRLQLGSSALPPNPYIPTLDPHADCCMNGATIAVWRGYVDERFVAYGWELSPNSESAMVSHFSSLIQRPKIVTLNTTHFLAWIQPNEAGVPVIVGRFLQANSLNPVRLLGTISDPAYPLDETFVNSWFDIDYLPSADVILVAWASTDHTRLAYQLIASSGERNGRVRAIGGGVTGRLYSSPGVVAGSDSFLVTYGGGASLVSSDGEIISNVTLHGAPQPVAAFDSNRGRFLIAYTVRANDRDTVGSLLEGRFISEAGELDRTTLALTEEPRTVGGPMLGNTLKPLLAFSEARDQYAIGWYKTDPHSGWLNHLYTRLLSANGTPINSWTMRGHSLKTQGGGGMTAGDQFSVVYQEASLESAGENPPRRRINRSSIAVYYDGFTD